MQATKTTLYLDDSLRQRLKVIAARRGKTLTALLTEGAKLVIARHQGALDRSELMRRATAARAELRSGLYHGAAISESVDSIAYDRRNARGATRKRARR